MGFGIGSSAGWRTTTSHLPTHSGTCEVEVVWPNSFGSRLGLVLTVSPARDRGRLRRLVVHGTLSAAAGKLVVRRRSRVEIAHAFWRRPCLINCREQPAARCSLPVEPPSA